MPAARRAVLLFLLQNRCLHFDLSTPDGFAVAAEKR
jgi:hypothetical protein